MSYRPSDTASKIVALLENAKMLAIHHQRRFLASDVVIACKIFSEGRRFAVPAQQYESLAAAVKGKMNGELEILFEDLKRLVVAEDMKLQAPSFGRDDKAGLHNLADKIRGSS